MYRPTAPNTPIVFITYYYILSAYILDTLQWFTTWSSLFPAEAFDQTFSNFSTPLQSLQSILS